MASTPDKRLFGRIVVLAFLLGLVYGLWGVLIGISLYKSTWQGFGLMIPYSFGWPLDALQIILGGAGMVLLVTVPDLCGQFTQGSQWKDNHHAFVRFCSRFLKILGFCLMSEGIISLLDKPLSILYPEQEQGIIFFLILFVPLCIVIFSWYVFAHGKRRAKEEGVLSGTRGEDDSERDLEGAD